ncbi:MAG: hypothetical protein F4148_11760 [Caldilineaceae bacterium SB0675_bin_29]|uniref:Uncharacterized protein n=1 Tax=Caldilineaceae bacterium SB0675_bin_29 TaxID=2605266 RepID=A0A6B1G2U3_9CHLR|nr:hypothetical protein [Caldilineaceae bacterium SB0675_bin_29]
MSTKLRNAGCGRPGECTCMWQGFDAEKMPTRIALVTQSWLAEIHGWPGRRHPELPAVHSARDFERG